MRDVPKWIFVWHGKENEMTKKQAIDLFCKSLCVTAPGKDTYEKCQESPCVELKNFIKFCIDRSYIDPPKTEWRVKKWEDAKPILEKCGYISLDKSRTFYIHQKGFFPPFYKNSCGKRPKRTRYHISEMLEEVEVGG